MPAPTPSEFAAIYCGFDAPIAAFDCGKKCAPHNARGVPFCCDTRHAVPTAYQAEWQYLQASTDLWHPWEADSPRETDHLRSQTPAGQVLIECQGHTRCQRSFRSMNCRSFPFFPYLTREGEFIGLSYFWKYEDRCWVISHLDSVTPAYQQAFVAAWDALFAAMPGEMDNFHRHSAATRQIFGRRGRAINVLHRNGGCYKITPRNGRMRRVPVESLPLFGVYKIAASLPFAGED